MILALTIVIGLLLVEGAYSYLKYRIITFKTGKWRLKISKDSKIVVISFYKWLFVSNVDEANRRLEAIIKKTNEERNNNKVT